MKHCCRCKQLKPIENFGFGRGEKDGRKDVCKSCRAEEHSIYYQNNKERILQRGRAWNKNNVEKKRALVRKSKLKRFYNTTMEWFQTTLLAQDNRCAVCIRPFTDAMLPEVDHNHATGQLRGLLCNDCNIAEGFLKTVENCQRMIRYLRTHSFNRQAAPGPD
jgi:hypothetical protein